MGAIVEFDCGLSRKTGVTSYRRYPEYEGVSVSAQQITVKVTCRIIFKPLYEV
jgi:hypothetical protein